MRAAIYGRYSTEKQDQSSIADQWRACTDYATQRGWEIVERHADEGISGAAIGNRPGFASLMTAALAGLCDVVLVMDLSRLSRSAADLNKTIDRLTFRGVRVIGVSNGYDSERKGHKMQAGVEGIMGEAFREMVRDKTHAALDGRARSGLFAGGLAYGYVSTETPGGRTLVVNPDQAEWVRWIFARYVEGLSPRRIAHELNRLRVPSPRGRTWAVSAIIGSPAKGTGILNNEAYAGRLVWNRSQFVKHPDTGVRKRFERPPSEWIIQHRPDIQIVSAEIWAAARQRMGAPGARGGGAGAGRRPSTLFGGLLRCGLCGGAVVAINATRYGCAAHKDRGPTVCAGVQVPRSHTDARLLSAIRDHLLAPAKIAALQAQVQRLMQARAANHNIHKAKARLAELDRAISNLTSAIEAAGWSQALIDRLTAAEAERTHLQAVVSGPAKPTAVPAVLARYKTLLADLQTALSRAPEQARAALGQVLGDIRVVPDGTQVWAEIQPGTGQMLMLAGVDKCGSGGAILEMSTPIRIRII